MYEKYKPTDQIWLPNIPIHWKTEKIKHLFSERIEKGYPQEPLLVSSQNMGVVPKNVYGNRTVEAQKDLHLLKLVKKGDFVISLRAFQGGIEYAYYQGIISPAYTIMVNKGNINSFYFKYLAKSSIFIDLLRLCVTGIREGQNIDYNRLKNFKLPIPPRAEQDQIVRFLDWKVSAINRLINLKQKQIIDIYNLKQIEINYKLGISKSKDIEKLRLKNISRIYGRIGFRGYSRNDMVDEGEGAITTSPSNIEEDKVVFDKCSYVSWEKYEESPEIKLGKNDILVVKTGSSYGKTGFIENELSYPATINPQLLIIRGITEKVIPKYLYFVIKYGNIQEQINRNVIGSTIPTISENRISSMYLSLPDKSIQYKVITEVEKIICKYFSLVSSLLKQIETLQELKTRLIADAVTGKIDIRGVEVGEVVAKTEGNNGE